MHRNYFDKCNRKVCAQTLFFCGGAEWLCLKRAGVLMNRSFKVDSVQMTLWAVASLTCMQNVGAWRMLGECATRCHLKIWSLGGCAMHGYGRKLLNILNRCVKKVYSQIIPLLFVFCQLVECRIGG
jgi:hypothetical protein